MTVQELIDKLTVFEPNLHVLIEVDGNREEPEFTIQVADYYPEMTDSVVIQ